MLKPIVPLKEIDFPMSAEARAELILMQMEHKANLEKIKDESQKEAAFVLLNKMQANKQLGIALHDQKVQYNPKPWDMMLQILNSTVRNLKSLFVGDLNPKWMSGPVGIVQVMQISWATGAKEALFWVGMVSLGLGIFNLFPIPSLDGGYILISLFEMITGRTVQPKTMQKIIFPFFMLILGFLIFVTYHDISRLLK